MRDTKFYPPMKIGINLFKKFGYKAFSLVEPTVERFYGEYQTKKAMLEEGISHREKRLQDTEAQREKEKKARGVGTDQESKSGLAWSWFNIILTLPMKATSISLIFNSVLPSFQGREHWAVVSAVGGGLVTAYSGHRALEALHKKLSNPEWKTFMVVLTLLVLLSGLGGAMYLSKSRSIQNQMHEIEFAWIGDPDQLKRLEEMKMQVEKYNSRGMILMFAGLELTAAMFLFEGLRLRRRYGPVAKLAKKSERLEGEINQLKMKRAFYGAITKEGIRGQIMEGIAKAKVQGSPITLIIVIGVIVGALVFFLLSESVFGKPATSEYVTIFETHRLTCGPFEGPYNKISNIINSLDLSEVSPFALVVPKAAYAETTKPRYYLICLDRTGSTAHDELENERTVREIIMATGPGDKIQVLLVTEDTFSNPEYILSKEMPSKVGYFPLELKRAQLDAVKEFQTKIEQLSNERPATSLIDGIYMFAKFCKENARSREPHLLLLSDMIQFTKYLDPETIVQDPNKAFVKVKDDGLIPDMKGINTYCMGVSPAGLEVKEWRSLEIFWTKFFNAAGADLRCYDMNRVWAFD